jgi:hypothetical protein
MWPKWICSSYAVFWLNQYIYIYIYIWRIYTHIATVTDLLKAFLGSSSVNTFQRTTMEDVSQSSQSQSHIATDGQSVSKSWCRAPSGTHDQIFSYCYLTVTVFFLWGALSDERTGLSFVYAAGSFQRSLSRVWVPWDSRPYFTVSDLRLPILSPLTTRRVTVEVFYIITCGLLMQAMSLTKDRSVLSSERAPHIKKIVTVEQY